MLMLRKFVPQFFVGLLIKNFPRSSKQTSPAVSTKSYFK